MSHPSHLTFPQVAVAVGVSRAAVLDRASKREADYAPAIFGTRMIRWGAVREWQRERGGRARRVLANLNTEPEK